MKRLIAAAILLVFVASVYFTGYIYTDKACKKTTKLLEECVTAYDSNENPENKAEDLKEYWAKAEKTLSIFANHARIDEIEKSIDTLLIYSNTDEKEIFKEYSGEVKTLLHQLMEDTVPSVHSVF